MTELKAKLPKPSLKKENPFTCSFTFISFLLPEFYFLIQPSITNLADITCKGKRDAFASNITQRCEFLNFFPALFVMPSDIDVFVWSEAIIFRQIHQHHCLVRARYKSSIKLSRKEKQKNTFSKVISAMALLNASDKVRLFAKDEHFYEIACFQ